MFKTSNSTFPNSNFNRLDSKGKLTFIVASNSSKSDVDLSEGNLQSNVNLNSGFDSQVLLGELVQNGTESEQNLTEVNHLRAIILT